MQQPQTIAANQGEKIRALLLTGLVFAKTSDEIVSLESESSKLSKVDPSEGYAQLATSAMLQGNYKLMRDRIAIAMNHGINTLQRFNLANVYAHAGFFSEGAKFISNSWDNLIEDISFTLETAIQLYQFNTYAQIYEKRKDIIEQLPASRKKELDQGYKVCLFARENNISDKELSVHFDLLGEVLRDNLVYYKMYRAPNSLGDSATYNEFSAFYFVPTSFDTASELTYQLTQKVIDQPLSNKIFLKFVGDRE